MFLDLRGDFVDKEHYFGWGELGSLDFDEFGKHYRESLTCMVVKYYQLVVAVLLAYFLTDQVKCITAVNCLVRLHLEQLYLTLDREQIVYVSVDDQNLV